MPRLAGVRCYSCESVRTRVAETRRDPEAEEDPEVGFPTIWFVVTCDDCGARRYFGAVPVDGRLARRRMRMLRAERYRFLVVDRGLGPTSESPSDHGEKTEKGDRPEDDERDDLRQAERHDRGPACCTRRQHLAW